MELHFTPEQEAQLTRIARHEGKPAEQLIAEKALLLLDEDNDFPTAVHIGLADADAGNLIEEQAMDKRFAALMRR